MEQASGIVPGCEAAAKQYFGLRSIILHSTKISPGQEFTPTSDNNPSNRMKCFSNLIKWQALLALFACAGEVDMCAEAGAPRPGPLSFLFSYQRPQTYQFQISQEQRERERETTDRKGIFFFLPFSEVNRMSAPLTFHRGKQLFIRAQQRQRPTWEPSDITQLIWSSVPKLLSAERTSRLTENNFNDR